VDLHIACLSVGFSGDSAVPKGNKIGKRKGIFRNPNYELGRILYGDKGGGGKKTKVVWSNVTGQKRYYIPIATPNGCSGNGKRGDDQNI